ncbi:Flp pilus assembly protein CpaB [Vibrio sp. SCSIO 43140]|uniref:Flp pilus assembly protein CpaB n=1 Tax=Vibrio sp. SCSIO 43140 TaxID=2819100 RepID=UPI002074B40E|nr:Flp pilus assembly protein CpaB [Vibrio sp. SCSIO 43140]USD61758.1 Flp pilus assembly protein CpaB [Vibrio sp. SCSIO 43140]
MRSRLVLVVAVLALVIGVFGLRDLLRQKSEQQNDVTETAPSQRVEEHVSVWRVKSAISKGMSIRTDQVDKLQLPLSKALAKGIKKDIQIDFSPSTLSNRNLSVGDLVLPEYQVRVGQSGYIDLLVTEGMTPYPLQVSDKNLINDYIRPGTYIDILTVSSPNNNLAANSDKPRNFKGVNANLFLQQVKVLNVDSNENGSVTAKAPTKEQGFTTVVIEVKPDDLPRLALAQRTMHIEVYRSQTYRQPTYVEVRNIMTNYMGVEEFRGNASTSGETIQ